MPPPTLNSEEPVNGAKRGSCKPFEREFPCVKGLHAVARAATASSGTRALNGCFIFILGWILWALHDEAGRVRGEPVLGIGIGIAECGEHEKVAILGYG